MNILYLMIPISLMLVAAFLVLFLWSNENGQLDDLDTPAHKMLEEDEIKTVKEEENES